MASRYGVTVAQVRATSGITTKFINDADMEQLIDSAEYEIEKKQNAYFLPRTIIEQYQGNGAESMALRHNPVLKVRALQIDSTSVTPEYVRVDKQGGILHLTTSAEITFFKSKSSESNLVRVKYDHGLMENTAVNTTSSAASTAGDSVEIEVADSSSFAVDDYVEVQGMDSYQETAKISAINDATHLTLDNLAYPHESGSMVTKVQVPQIGIRMMQIGAAMMAVARVVGQSFDEITGYSLGDMSVQKGEPYTQWREVTTQLQKEWKTITEVWRQRPAMGV